MIEAFWRKGQRSNKSMPNELHMLFDELATSLFLLSFATFSFHLRLLSTTVEECSQLLDSSSAFFEDRRVY